MAPLSWVHRGRVVIARLLTLRAFFFFLSSFSLQSCYCGLLKLLLASKAVCTALGCNSIASVRLHRSNFPTTSRVAPTSGGGNSMAESQPRGSSKMRQTRLLLQKNYHVSRRNLFATTFPLLIPPLFCFVVFIMGVDDRHNRNGFNAATFDVRHPTTSKITDLPMCDTIRMPGCTSPLGIVGTLTSDAQAVIDIILAAHPDVAPDVTYYGSSAALNNELLAHPQKVLAAVHFDDAFSLAKPKYILQYNTTRACLLGAFSCNDPPLDVGIPLQLGTPRRRTPPLVLFVRCCNSALWSQPSCSLSCSLVEMAAVLCFAASTHLARHPPTHHPSRSPRTCMSSTCLPVPLAQPSKVPSSRTAPAISAPTPHSA